MVVRTSVCDLSLATRGAHYWLSCTIFLLCDLFCRTLLLANNNHCFPTPLMIMQCLAQQRPPSPSHPAKLNHRQTR